MLLMMEGTNKNFKNDLNCKFYKQEIMSGYWREFPRLIHIFEIGESLKFVDMIINEEKYFYVYIHSRNNLPKKFKISFLHRQFKSILGNDKFSIQIWFGNSFMLYHFTVYTIFRKLQTVRKWH